MTSKINGQLQPTIKIRVQASRKIGEDIHVFEAETQVSVNATDQEMTSLKETMCQWAERFAFPEPVPAVSGVNEWFTPALARAVSHLYLVGTLVKVSEAQGKNLAGEVVLLFGKHQGKTIGQLAQDEPNYLQYILQQGYDARPEALSPEFRLAYAAVSAYSTLEQKQGEKTCLDLTQK